MEGKYYVSLLTPVYQSYETLPKTRELSAACGSASSVIETELPVETEKSAELDGRVRKPSRYVYKALGCIIGGDTT